jgi:hypothetical protein
MTNSGRISIKACAFDFGNTFCEINFGGLIILWTNYIMEEITRNAREEFLLMIDDWFFQSTIVNYQ